MQNSNFKTEFKKRLYDFVLRLIRYINSIPKNSTNDVLTKQLLRSGTSILANYIEAQAASSKKDFTNFLTHSLKSSNESKVWFALLRDTNKINKNDVQWLLGEVVEISNIIAKSIITMRDKNKL